jgi:hypothetical protein
MLTMLLHLAAQAGGDPLAVCTAEALARAETRSLQSEFVAQVVGEHPLPPAARQSLERLFAAAQSCGRRFPASRDKGSAFVDQVVVGVALDAFSRSLAKERLDPAAAYAVLAAAGPETLDRLIARDYAHPDVVRLMQQLLALLGPDEGTALQRRLLGAYSINAARRLRGM